MLCCCFLLLSLGKKVWFYYCKLCLLLSRFFFADKAVGAKGFKAIWTEFKDTSNCQEFRCAKNQICIPRTLRCNGINNCGHMDTSDEMNCVTESEVSTFNRALSKVVSMSMPFAGERVHDYRLRHGHLVHGLFNSDPDLPSKTQAKEPC